MRCGNGWFAFLLLAVASLVHAQVPPPPADGDPQSPPASPAPAAALTEADLSAYVDGVVTGYMRRLGIAGVTVAIVQGDAPLLLRGYGIATQTPAREVDARDTLFRVGSVSKTFTYLLALKLADAGRLRLDAPVNDYLPADLRLAEDGYRPVLVRHLLTHTAGYEDSALGHLFARTPQQVTSLHDYLLRHRPARVREPDTYAVYSNYSVALLGAVLAQIEGLPFEALAERDLFTPLGMRHTTFREPLDDGDARGAPAALKPLWSAGFKRSGGGFRPQGFEYIGQVAPAGAVSSSAADMARYLRMLLNRGQLDGAQVLPAGVFDRLDNDPPVRNAPDAGAITHGFFRRSYGQVRSFEHAGATLYFHSNLVVVPELGFGVFVSTNTDTGRRLAYELPELLLERYFPRARAAALPQPPAGFSSTGKRYAGTYLGQRRSYATFEKALNASTAGIGLTGDGYLTLSAAGETTRWVWEKADTFRAVQGSARLSFLTDAQGKVRGFVAPGGHDVFDRAGPFDNPQVFNALLGLAQLTALGVLFGEWQRRRQSAGKAGASGAAARWLGWAALAWLVFVAVFVLALLLLGQEDTAIYAYPTPLLRLALWLAPPALLLSVVALCFAPAAWRAPGWNVWRKLRHGAALLVFLLAGYALWVWNAVGWKL